MKKLINDPQNVVSEMLEGLVVMSPGMARLAGHNVVVRADSDEIRHRQVALISGGGSGHEPAHAGYIGDGMLSAAVAGEVFTSPSTGAIVAAIRAVAGKAGVLLIVKNYTGDRLNFGLAAEIARAEGIAVEMVLVADDVALLDREPATGHRGIAGTVLVHKIAGACAASGRSLAEVTQIAKRTAGSIATMGLSLSPGISPSVGKPNFLLADDEIELGLGIHGEPGIERRKLEPADALVDRLLHSVFAAQALPSGTRVVLLINNLGSTTEMELAIVARHAAAAIERQGLIIERILYGTFMSSLETAGISLSLLPVDDETLAFLDAGTTAPAWPRVQPASPGGVRVIQSAIPSSTPVLQVTKTRLGRTLERAINSACTAIIAAEPELTQLDQAVGDGDLGISMMKGATSVHAALSTWALDDPAATMKSLGIQLQEALGGSSGPLYGVLFLRAAALLSNRKPVQSADWADALQEGCNAIQELGGASLGDRTMLDALIPFERQFRAALQQNLPLSQALASAVQAADDGVEASKNMQPRRGRSSYLGDRVFGHPDPGARAVAIWLRAIQTGILRADRGRE